MAPSSATSRPRPPSTRSSAIRTRLGAGAAVEWTAIDSVFVQVGASGGRSPRRRTPPRAPVARARLRGLVRHRHHPGRGADRLAHLAAARRVVCPAGLRNAAARAARHRPAARPPRRRQAAPVMEGIVDARRSGRHVATSARRPCSASGVRRSSVGPAAKTTVPSIGRSRRDRSPARSPSPTPTRRKPSSPKWSAISPTSWRCACGRWAGSRVRSRCVCGPFHLPRRRNPARPRHTRPQPNRLVRSVTLREATALDEDLRAAAASLLKVLWRRQPVGGLGLVLSNLQPTGPQMPLFPLVGQRTRPRADRRHAAGSVGPSRAGRSALRLPRCPAGVRGRWPRFRSRSERCRPRAREQTVERQLPLRHRRDRLDRAG